jgi:hypothetical protein
LFYFCDGLMIWPHVTTWSSMWLINMTDHCLANGHSRIFYVLFRIRLTVPVMLLLIMTCFIRWSTFREDDFLKLLIELKQRAVNSLSPRSHTGIDIRFDNLRNAGVRSLKMMEYTLKNNCYWLWINLYIKKNFCANNCELFAQPSTNKGLLIVQ